MAGDATSRSETVEHTAGPWIATEPNRWGTVHIRDAAVPPLAIAEVIQADARYPSSANAALIVAAPDLLAALEDVTDAVERMALRLDKEPGNQTVVALWLHKVNAARAAIAKARGRAPAPPERTNG